jgi:hypothetical protein
MQVIFRGDPLERARGQGISRTAITIEGVIFVLDEPRDASSLSDRAKRKLAANNHFEVVAAPEAPKAGQDAAAEAADGDGEKTKRSAKAKAE